MNKQEILEEIKKTEEHLSNMEKMLKECEYERWKPQKDELYYYLNSYNIAIPETWDASCYSDTTKWNTYNCFKNREEAEQEAEKILVRRMLEDIARRLNKGQKIDWDNNNQIKYYFYFDFLQNEMFSYHRFNQKKQGVVYCLDKNFLDIAIQEIGEERLKKYLRGE
mgnify:CR=1 FL=1